MKKDFYVLECFGVICDNEAKERKISEWCNSEERMLYIEYNAPNRLDKVDYDVMICPFDDEFDVYRDIQRMYDDGLIVEDTHMTIKIDGRDAVCDTLYFDEGKLHIIRYYIRTVKRRKICEGLIYNKEIDYFDKFDILFVKGIRK
jgi:hypothetical protein